MGKSTGVCGGRGGSQHIHWKNLYSNGIQGGIVPIATGMALAEKTKDSNAAVAVFLGDGTFGEGVIYEAFNMASLWQLPILYVVENNHIAQTTPCSLALSGEFSQRFNAFCIPSIDLDTSDVNVISSTASQLIGEVHEHCSPRALILNTERFGPHSKGDDTRSEENLAIIRSSRDPLMILAKSIPKVALGQVQTEVEKEVKQAFALALSDPVSRFIGVER
jgi:TPP-dependent pyruvate/acetoin dehydrogenase alpha subunit